MPFNFPFPQTLAEWSSLITSILGILGFLLGVRAYRVSRAAQQSKSDVESSDFAINLKKITDDTVEDLMRERRERQEESHKNQAKIQRLEARVRDLEDIIRTNDKFHAELWVDGSPLLSTIKVQQKNRWRWQGKGNMYWFLQLIRAIFLLFGSLVGLRHEPVRWELMQIAAICLNWMNRQDDDKSRTQPVPPPEGGATAGGTPPP